MGKRSDFVRMKNDFYATPHSAVIPLLPHLPSQIRYIEPCVGAGHLVRHLESHGHKCTGKFDLPIDASTHQYLASDDADFFITNPPWTRSVLHPIITNLRNQLPTWLLFDADWAYTKQASEHLKYCAKIVAIGRVKWIENSKHVGKDNSAWYLFTKESAATIFFGKHNGDANEVSN